MTTAAAPVTRTVGDLNRYFFGLKVVQLGIRPLTGVHTEARTVAATLCAVTVGEYDSGQRYITMSPAQPIPTTSRRRGWQP